MDDPESWRWIWLGTAAVFAIGEMLTPGSFALVPFALGAGAASLLAFLDMSTTSQWLAFVIVSIASLIALRPLAHRLDRRASDDGVGARRLLGQDATVLQDIPGNGGLGLVLVHREEWRAESAHGQAIPSGTSVRVADVRGTRVVVATVDALPSGEAGRS